MPPTEMGIADSFATNVRMVSVIFGSISPFCWMGDLSRSRLFMKFLIIEPEFSRGFGDSKGMTNRHPSTR